MRLRFMVRLAFLLGLIPFLLQAQDVRGKRILRPMRPLDHFGDSAFDPPQTTDHLFLVDTGPSLDTGCSFHSDGPLLINIPLNRGVGAVTSRSRDSTRR